MDYCPQCLLPVVGHYVCMPVRTMTPFEMRAEVSADAASYIATHPGRMALICERIAQVEHKHIESVAQEIIGLVKAHSPTGTAPGTMLT